MKTLYFYLIVSFPSKTSQFFIVPDIDFCAANPCENGGSCQDSITGYSCSCQQGFTGDNCESGGYMKTLYFYLFVSFPPETSNSLLYQKSTFVLQTHVKMEDHTKMVSLDTAVPANKDLLGTIVKQVCINTLCIYLIGSFHF